MEELGGMDSLGVMLGVLEDLENFVSSPVRRELAISLP